MANNPMVDEPDYERHKAQLEFDLTSLVVPEATATPGAYHGRAPGGS